MRHGIAMKAQRPWSFTYERHENTWMLLTFTWLKKPWILKCHENLHAMKTLESSKILHNSKKSWKLLNVIRFYMIWSHKVLNVMKINAAWSSHEVSNTLKFYAPWKAWKLLNVIEFCIPWKRRKFLNFMKSYTP